MARRPPDGEEPGDDRVNGPTADRLEEQWEHALDAADHAVEAGARSRALRPHKVSTQRAHIREERKWLVGVRSTLRRLLPRRKKEPPNTT